MAKVYVSDISIRESISYFNETTFQSSEQIGLFFLFKAAKINSRDYTQFSRIGNMTPEEKQRHNRILYNLCGLFESNTEKGEKYNSLFPFSIHFPIKKSYYYNGGTPFNRILSRVFDTIDNTLVDETKYLRRDEMNAERFKFPPNYLSILKENFLQEQRISLTHFASWYFRFHEFEVDESWVDTQTQENYEAFTRACIKQIKNDLNITQDEIVELFDIDDTLISFKSTQITGEELRAMLSFEADAVPETSISATPVDYMQARITLPYEMMAELLTPHGNNVTEEQLFGILESTRQTVLSGPPGTGKSFISNSIRSRFDDSLLVQFHPNLTYEQFIGGLTFDETGNVHPKSGIFLEYCENARTHPDNKYLFLIDEINRANVSKVFGEIILALDREYTAHLPTPLKLSNGNTVTEFSIPSNVYILATMNSADRSIALVDYAIRRRFAFIPFYPNSEIVDYLSDYTNLHTVSVGKLMDRLNERLYSVLGDADLLLGQSYFMPKWVKENGRYVWTDEALKSLFNYYILPIIEEYTYGNRRYLINITGDKLLSRITDTEEFVSEICEQFGN